MSNVSDEKGCRSEKKKGEQKREKGREEQTAAWTDMRGKVAVVTGATSGIGLQVSKALLLRGCKVVMACRSMEKGEKCKKEITGEDSEKASRCDLVQLDLANLTSVRSCAETIFEKHPKICILVNNAGVFCSRRSLSQDGIELTFAVNHLGHFLLTRLLLPCLLRCQPARIVNVSSEAHRISSLKLSDVQLQRGWTPLKAYGRSKSASVLFAVCLSRLLQYTHVSICSVHPGVVDTHLGDALEGSCFMTCFRLLSVLCCQRLLTPEQGAEAVVRLCVREEFKSGAYFNRFSEARAKKHSTEVGRASTLWRVSSRLCRMPLQPHELGAELLTSSHMASVLEELVQDET